LKLYIEHLYNLYIQQFPFEQHALLHDVYIQSNNKVSNTQMPGNKNVQVRSRKGRKNSFSDLHTGVLNKEGLIRLWNSQTILKKAKAKKTLNNIVILPSMCIKINNLDYLREKVNQLSKEITVSKAEFKITAVMCKNVHECMIDMLIKSINLYISSQTSSILSKTKKKSVIQILQRYKSIN